MFLSNMFRKNVNNKARNLDMEFEKTLQNMGLTYEEASEILTITSSKHGEFKCERGTVYVTNDGHVNYFVSSTPIKASSPEEAFKKYVVYYLSDSEKAVKAIAEYKRENSRQRYTYGV